MRQMTYYLTVEMGVTGEWYWHIIAPNGRVIADGAEGYAKKSGAIRAAKRFITVATEGVIALRVVT